MALNFPNTPVEGAIYYAEGVTYRYTSGRWEIVTNDLDSDELLAGFVLKTGDAMTGPLIMEGTQLYIDAPSIGQAQLVLRDNLNVRAGILYADNTRTFTRVGKYLAGGAALGAYINFSDTDTTVVNGPLKATTIYPSPTLAPSYQLSADTTHDYLVWETGHGLTFNRSTKRWDFVVASVSKMALDSSGNVSMAGSLSVVNGVVPASVLAPTFSLSADATVNAVTFAPGSVLAFFRATNQITLYQNGAQRLSFTDGGPIWMHAPSIQLGDGAATTSPILDFNTTAGQPYRAYAAYAPGLYIDLNFVFGSTAFVLRNTGVGYAPGGWQTGSDIRIKTNIEVIPNALDKIDMLRGCTFDKAGSPARQAGYIAQEMQAVLPEGVSNTGDVTLEGGTVITDLLSVDPMGAIALLIEGVKELRSEAAMLHTRIKQLEDASP